MCLISSCTPEIRKKTSPIVDTNCTQLNGGQSLDETGKVVIPYSKQGFTIHLPHDNSIGTIIFLSGSAMDTTRNADEFALIKPALANNMAVLFVSTGKVFEFLFTDAEINVVDKLIGESLSKHKLIDKPKILAGTSFGGTMALKYSEYCLLNKSKFKFKANAIVLCDAPLDMVRMFHEQEQALKNNVHPAATGEAQWVLAFLRRYLGGSPDEAMENYIRYSPFVYSDVKKSKIELFKNMPIRMYHEPDINWWVENRGKDYNTINSIDLAGFYNYLRKAGNPEVELITSWNKRKNYNNGSSPHTWSIVDDDELVEWMLEKL